MSFIELTKTADKSSDFTFFFSFFLDTIFDFFFIDWLSYDYKYIVMHYVMFQINLSGYRDFQIFSESPLENHGWIQDPGSRNVHRSWSLEQV